MQSVSEPPDTTREVPLLDRGTQLPNGLVHLSWWPSAGEAVAYVPAGTSDNSLRVPPSAEVRAAENLERAARRARSRVRRYVVANSCTRMLTLTFAPKPSQSDPELWSGEAPQVAEAVHKSGSDGACAACGRPHGELGVRLAMRRVARFIERLRGDRDAFPYVVVPEFHQDEHVHVHVLVNLSFTHDEVERAWSFGFVDVGKARSPDGGRAAARKAATYATKYVAKAFESSMPRRHRYEVAQGFQPAVVKRGGYGCFREALSFVMDHMQTVTYSVSSEDIEDYRGPPFLWVVLDDG